MNGSAVAASARRAAVAGRQWTELRSDGQRLCWLEFDPDQATVRLLEKRGRQASRVLTPEGWSVRSRVHEYGGGAYCLTGDGVVFVNEEDQGLYQLSGDSADRCRQPRRLYRERGCRYGDLVFDPVHQRILAVEERHGLANEPENRLVAIRCSDGQRQLLAEGADFYASPRISADGRQMAWLSWNHPHQPWLSTCLSKARLDSRGLPLDCRAVTAGHYAGQQESVFQPEFGPDGALYFVSDRTGWWNLYRSFRGQTRALLPMAAEFGVAQWQLGLRSYCLLPGNRIACSLIEQGIARLGILELDSGRFQRLDGSWARCHSLCCHQQQLLLVAESSLAPACLLSVDAQCGISCTLESLQPAILSAGGLPGTLPRSMTFESGDGAAVQGFYYSAAGCHSSWQPPPLLIQLHGGPTSMADAGYNPLRQFWTGRGFAVLELNYRGSSGFGRSYRHCLKEQWGVLELEDLFSACEYLVRSQLADPRRIMVRGNSAGGYTVLRALADRRAAAAGLCAGASHYGISDLELLNSQTHKFESRYLHWLIGDPESARERYLERSAIHHPEAFATPLIFFQGALDPVVPAVQTRRLYRQLKLRGLPVALQSFADERHGFRQADNRARVLEQEWSFYQQRVNGRVAIANADGSDAMDSLLPAADGSSALAACRA